MIPANKDRTQRARSLCNFIGIRTVADDVAQVEDAVVFRRGLQAGVERFKVSVNVRQDEDAQAEFSPGERF
jgi:hypothetical protein